MASINIKNAGLTYSQRITGRNRLREGIAGALEQQGIAGLRTDTWEE